jgi:hypothetical protein
MAALRLSHMTALRNTENAAVENLKAEEGRHKEEVESLRKDHKIEVDGLVQGARTER